MAGGLVLCSNPKAYQRFFSPAVTSNGASCFGITHSVECGWHGEAGGTGFLENPETPRQPCRSARKPTMDGSARCFFVRPILHYSTILLPFFSLPFLNLLFSRLWQVHYGAGATCRCAQRQQQPCGCECLNSAICSSGSGDHERKNNMLLKKQMRKC